MSLETPVGESEDSHLGEFIPDDKATVEDTAIADALKTSLVEVLDTLKTREREVVMMRFGIMDEKLIKKYNLEAGVPLTLEQVGGKFGVTRERIRQIEAKALRIMRKPKNSSKLIGYTDKDEYYAIDNNDVNVAQEKSFDNSNPMRDILFATDEEGKTLLSGSESIILQKLFGINSKVLNRKQIMEEYNCSDSDITSAVEKYKQLMDKERFNKSNKSKTRCRKEDTK